MQIKKTSEEAFKILIGTWAVNKSRSQIPLFRREGSEVNMISRKGVIFGNVFSIENFLYCLSQ